MTEGAGGRPVRVLPLWQRGPAAAPYDAHRPGVRGHTGPVVEGGEGQLTATADQAAATAAYSVPPAP